MTGTVPISSAGKRAQLGSCATQRQSGAKIPRRAAAACLVLLVVLTQDARPAEPPAPLFEIPQSTAQQSTSHAPDGIEYVHPAAALQPDPFSQNIEPGLLQRIEEQLTIRPLREATITLAPPAAPPQSTGEAFFRRSGTVDDASTAGFWYQQSYSGHFANVCHQPLYFEEVNLERYGYYWGKLQPSLSSVHFFATLPLLPYKMAADPPCSCHSNLQHAPAGTCAPPEPLWKPLDVRAVFVQSAAVAGVVLLFP